MTSDTNVLFGTTSTVVSTHHTETNRQVGVHDVEESTHRDDVQRVVADFANLGILVVHQVDQVGRSFFSGIKEFCTREIRLFDGIALSCIKRNSRTRLLHTLSN